MKYWTVAVLIIFNAELPGQSSLTIEQIMQGPDFVGYLPDQAFWSNDSRSIYFQWNQDSLADDEMYHFTLGASAAERLSVEGVKALESPNGIYSKDGLTKLYGKNGDLFLKSASQVRQITNTIQREVPRGFSADEKLVVFEMEDNLFTWSIENGTIEQLTQFKKGDEKKEEKLDEQDSWLKRDQETALTNNRHNVNIFLILKEIILLAYVFIMLKGKNLNVTI
jgi:hypothetical protein